MALPDKIALAGVSRCGKSTLGNILVSMGWTQRSFGDIIKRQLDIVIQRNLGFSAFTEVDSEKTQIRGVLEQWGMAAYDNILLEFMSTLPVKCVNTRIMRIPEAEAWLAAGGVIWEVVRPGVEPATEFEAEELKKLKATGCISRVIINDKDKTYLLQRLEAINSRVMDFNDEVNINVIRRAWPRILNIIGAVNPLYESMLKKWTVIRLKGKIIIVEVGESFAENRLRAAQNEISQVINHALKVEGYDFMVTKPTREKDTVLEIILLRGGTKFHLSQNMWMDGKLTNIKGARCGVKVSDNDGNLLSGARLLQACILDEQICLSCIDSDPYVKRIRG